VTEGPLDEKVFIVLDSASYALTLRELSQKVQLAESIVAAALERLVANGRINMTADRTTRAYYTKAEHLF